MLEEHHPLTHRAGVIGLAWVYMMECRTLAARAFAMDQTMWCGIETSQRTSKCGVEHNSLPLFKLYFVIHVTKVCVIVLFSSPSVMTSASTLALYHSSRAELPLGVSRSSLIWRSANGHIKNMHIRTARCHGILNHHLTSLTQGHCENKLFN